MEKMYFGSNSLKQIPESMGSMLCLLELDFSNNGIDEIPISLSQCVALEKLHLGNTFVLSNCIYDFSYLTKNYLLFTGNNKIKTFPPEVFAGLTNLKELQLFKNKIVTIPSEISALIGMSLLLFLLCL